MKKCLFSGKMTVFSVFLLTFLLIFCFASCVDFINRLLTENFNGNSAITIQISVPHYASTHNVRLSIRGNDDEFKIFETLSITEGSIEEVTGAPQIYPGRIWTGTFKELRADTFLPGSIRIELFDKNGIKVTIGYNTVSITTYEEKTTFAFISTTPVVSRQNNSITQGEMRFLRINMTGGIEYKLTLTASGSWPDIFIFNSNGTYNNYYSISKVSESVIIFNPAKTVLYYIGIYADAGNVNQYSVMLSDNNSDDEFINNFSYRNFDGWITTSNNTNAGNPLPEIFYEGSERGDVINFNARNMLAGWENTIYKRINSLIPKVLSFMIKTDINPEHGELVLYINGNNIKSFSGLRGMWRSESIIVDAGYSIIEFVLEKKTDGYTASSDVTNSVRLDNISFVPDVTESVKLYPRGNLNTYIGAPENERIQFRAEAFRKDGTVRKSDSEFVFTGQGVNSVTGAFTPITPGNVQVRVTADGKSMSGNITVHPENYLRMPYTYPGTGITYDGYIGTEGSLTTNGGVIITYPSETTFSADGFFTLEGTVNNSAVYNYAYVQVVKTDDSSLETYYLVRDSFKQRIWLRFGAGDYTVTAAGISSITLSSELGAEGDFRGCSTYGAPVTFTVTNTRNDGKSADNTTLDKRFIYPSYLIQSDNFMITNLAADLTYGLLFHEKRKAIHDYIIINTVYDTISFNNVNARKKQDAVIVAGTRYKIDAQYPDGHFLAVCEGYSNLFAALARASGIEARYVFSESMGHGWNHVSLTGLWFLFDVTWNDPVLNSSVIGDMGPSYISYKYYGLVNLNGVDNDHYGYEINSGRSLIGSHPFLPKHQGAPDGWY